MRHQPSLPIRVLLCLALLASVAYTTRTYTLPGVGAWLNVGEDPTYSDCALVLNGDRETRPFAAADLYRQGKAGRILIMSTVTEPQPAEPETHEVVRSILIRCSVPESDIELIGRRCGTTFDEATALAEFLDRHPEDSISVVTNEYHTRRTRWVFRKVLGSKIADVRFVAARTDHFGAGNWWKHENGFVLYLSEFFKFGFYLIRYGNGLLYIAAALGLVSAGWWFRHRGSLQTSRI